MGFLIDKEVGEEFEQQVIEKLHTTFGIRFEKNSNPRGVDLVHSLLSCEVKWDRRVAETGNTFIELSGKDDRPSGLFAETGKAPSLFIIGCSIETLVFSTNHLQSLVYEWVETKKYKTINAGDGWRSKGLLVKWEELRKEALYII